MTNQINYLISAIILLGTGAHGSLLHTFSDCLKENGVPDIVGPNEKDWDEAGDLLRSAMVTVIAEPDNYNYVSKHVLPVFLDEFVTKVWEAEKSQQNPSDDFNASVSEVQQVIRELAQEIRGIFDKAPNADQGHDVLDMEKVTDLYKKVVTASGQVIVSDTEKGYLTCIKGWWFNFGNELSLAAEVQIFRHPDQAYLTDALHAVNAAIKKVIAILSKFD